MTESFKPQSPAFNREILVGISTLFLALIGFTLWGYVKFSNSGHDIPPHILNAPIAKHVGPEYFHRQLRQSLVATESPVPNKLESQSIPIAESTETKKVANPIRHAPTFGLPSYTKSAQEQQTTVASKETNPRVGVASMPEPENSFQPTAIDISQKLTPPVEPKDKPAIQTHAIAHKNKRPSKPKKLGNRDTLASAQLKPEPSSNSFSLPSKETRSSFGAPRPNQLRPVNDLADTTPDSSSFQPIPKPEISPALITPNDSNSFHANEPIKKSVPAVIPAVYQTESQTPERIVKSIELERTYQTKQGDSFWIISQTIYGDGRYFRALYKLNQSKIVSFDELPPSITLDTPPIQTLRARFPDLCPAETSEIAVATGSDIYRTIEGETLFDIARKLTGQASRYLELLELNRERLPHDITHLTRLSANIELKLPNQF